MDPDYSAQDVARCDLCNNAEAESYCDFCHVNLCKPCIGEHIYDEYDRHKIVPFQKRRSTLKYPKCAAHQYDSCKHQCKNCDEFVCSYCTASEQHKGHEFLKLEEIFITKKENIQKDTEELKNHIMPTYEEITINLENEISYLDDQYEKLTTEIMDQGEKLHKEIDNIITKMEQEISEIKVTHSSILKKHLDEIKDIQSQIKQALLALNEMEESNEVSLIIHYSSKNKEFSKFPPQVHVSMPKFIPQKMEREKSCSFFGELTPLSTAMEERVLTANIPNISVRELLDKPEVLNTINTGFKVLCNVTCFDDDRVWTSGDIGNITCFSIQGELQKTLNTASGDWPRDVAGDRNRTLLYSEWKTRTVYKVKNDQTEEFIRLQEWHPLNLCVTSLGDLLVTMHNDDKTQSKVVRYSGSTVKQTIQFDKEGKALYSLNSFFKYVAENRNLNVCVADWAAGAVVVVNQAGKLRFRYTGHPSATKNKGFEPRGITTDSQSHILTVDGKNLCIHVLSEDGQFLRHIHNLGLKQLFGICVDINDNLFVCENETGSVKQIKYLK